MNIQRPTPPPSPNNKPLTIQACREIRRARDSRAAQDGDIRGAHAGLKLSPSPLRALSHTTRTSHLAAVGLLLLINHLFVRSCWPSAAAICNTTLPGLKTGTSFNRSYLFLVSSHNTLSYRVSKNLPGGSPGSSGKGLSRVLPKSQKPPQGKREDRKVSQTHLRAAFQERNSFSPENI